MLTIGIHQKGCGFEQKWADALTARGAQVRWLDLYRSDPLEQVRGCDGVMWHFFHAPGDKQVAFPLLHVIETELGLPVFPDLRTAWHFDNKIAQTYLLQAHGIPMPRTWIFWREDEALAWAEQADYPVVFKLASGAGSMNVSLVRNAGEARCRIRRMFSRSGHIPMVYQPPKARPLERWWRELRNFGLRSLSAPAYVFLKRYPPLPNKFWLPEKNYALFQEFVAGNPFDTRITVIGNRAFGYRRMNRPNDFRASGSGNFNVDPAAIDPRCIRLAFEAASRLGVQSMACDILLRGPEKQPVMTEVNYGYVDWMVERCPGYWDSGLNWIAGRMWPEEAHVEDFLERIRRKPPSRKAP